MAKLENGNFGKPGANKVVSGVSSSDGDYVHPRPQSYRIFTCSGPNSEVSWRGVNGRMVTTVTNRHTPKGVGAVDERISGLMAQYTRVTPPWLTLEERCQEKLYDQLRGNSQLVVDLAEGGQTLSMVRSALNVRRYMAEFARNMIRSPRDSLKTLSSKWLEYRYGWTPLAYSLYEAAENLRKKVQDEELLVKARASQTRSVTGTLTTGTYGTQSYKQHSLTEKSSCRQEIGYRFRPPPPALQQIANWTSLNPLMIAWELTPLSFVADWFVNVGDQLAAWENYTLFSSSFRGGYRTRVVREDRTGSLDYGLEGPTPRYTSAGALVDAFYGYGGHASLAARWVQKDRVLITELPRPVGFRVTVNLNAKRIVDAAALTSGLWTKMLRGRR